MENLRFNRLSILLRIYSYKIRFARHGSQSTRASYLFFNAYTRLSDRGIGIIIRYIIGTYNTYCYMQFIIFFFFLSLYTNHR